MNFANIVIWACSLCQAAIAASFPEDFLFGFSTASYQVEGGWQDDGKGENVWDRFVHTRSHLIYNRSTGDVACDSYHRYKEDVKMLKNLGADVYRFSLSWSRILPTGNPSFINDAGIQYYSRLIDELLANNIQPMVTLFHWDLPQPLQDLGGWVNPIMADYFEHYSRIAFLKFGDRVKWWITFNEPLETCGKSYGGDTGAPALNMSGIADYLCTHTVLKSHARVYHLYRKKFYNYQKGKVGITLNGGWNEPLTDTLDDKKAAETAMEFQVGWFLHPLLGHGGDYPKVMRENINRNSRSENFYKSRLPYFSDSWKVYIQDALDFLGINHYSTYLTTWNNDAREIPSFANDVGVTYSQNSSWPGSVLSWLKVEPTGLRKKLNWIKQYTKNFPVFITENGFADTGELQDEDRINYYRLYLLELLEAIQNDGCNVMGYIAWSLMDNFEWRDGYRAKFGVYQVDFNSPTRKRTAKASVSFFKKLIKTKRLDF